MKSKQEIRKQIRSQRRSLSQYDKNQTSAALFHHFSKHPIFKKSKHIAAYISNDGELDLFPLMRHTQQLRKQLYLPTVHAPSFKHMWFAPFTKNTSFQDNRYGIPEPVCAIPQLKKARQLDLVLMPLVAFDNLGNRIGMGGGYYDRTFAYLKSRTHWKRPLLVGVAYDFQEIEHIPSDPWDVPIDGIVTETRFMRFR